MKLSELFGHIGFCFKIYITEADKKTKVGEYADKWEVPEELKEVLIYAWVLCENRILIALDR